MTVINPGGGATAGVTTFNTRNGVVTLSKADVTGTGLAATDVAALATANNLSDVTAATARTNLGLGTAATQASTVFAQVANNLSDVTAATARTNLGLGTAATQTTGTFAQVANNLSDVTAATARTNLGLGSLATSNGPIPAFQVLTSDMSTIASQTALQNVTGLGVSIGASATEIWLMEWWILFTAANQTMDIKFGFTVPASCTLRGGPYTSISSVNGWDTVAPATVPIAVVTESTTSALGTGTALQQGIPLAAIVFGGGTSGTVQLQYAQNTSDVGTLQILKGSCSRAVKLVA